MAEKVLSWAVTQSINYKFDISFPGCVEKGK